MKFYKLAFSNEAPNVRDAVWAKPVEGGFTLYLLENGAWKPLKLVDDNSTPAPEDDIAQNLIGSVLDKKSANTINGAKAYAKSQATTLLGTKKDEPTDMTLYGLKAYIDSKLSNK